MKRQLSLVLALVMILGTFTTVFAADTSTDAITEASTFLKDKGVLVGNMSGDLMLGEKLSRQDTAVLVARLMGELKIAQEFPTAENIPTYEDIKDDFYLPILAWAQANKTFVGHSDARFGFDDDVTAQEYSKVLLVALGYNVGPNGDNDLTWEATLAKAKDLGILMNINDDIKNTDEITRGEMAVMTFNALSVMMKDGTQTLAEKLGIVMPAATKLTAEVKDTKNLKEVVINLSNVKLADSDKLMDVANYRIDGVKVKDVTVDGNDVILLLEEALIKGREYKLTVANIETGLNGTYNFKAADNTLPTVEEVTVLGEYGIKVTTSEPIRDAKERNFLVDGRNVSMNIEMYGRDLILTPYYNESFPSNAETLTIKEIEDYAGLKATEKDFDIEIVRDDVAPKVTDVVSRGNKVEVTFDKDIYEKSVSEYGGRTSTGNISYQSGRQTIYADDAEKVDTNKVVYTFEREIPRRTNVTIKGVQNHSKVTMASVTQMPREEIDYSEPEIIDKKVSTTATTAEITLKFNKDVEGFLKNENDEKSGFEIDRHFTLYLRDVYRGQEVKDASITAKYDEDRDGKVIKDTVVVTITGIKEYNKTDDNNYVLEVENFTDESSVRNRMYRDYVDFKATAKSIFEVKDVDVYDGKGRNDSEITIEFNRSVDKITAEQNTNYLFDDGSDNLKDVKDLKGSVYAEKDGKIVTIVLPKDVRVDDFITMTMLNSLKDKDGNRLGASVVYDFDRDLILVGGETLNEALAKVAISKAETSLTQEDLDLAQIAVNKVTDAVEKAKLQIKLDETQEKIDVKAATTAVVKAEETKLQSDVNTAQTAIDKVEDATTKAALQARLDAVQGIIDGETDRLQDARDAVEAAVTARTQPSVNAAQILVNALPDGTDKTALQATLDMIQAELDEAEATAAVVAAEANRTQANLTSARNLVNDLSNGSVKNALQVRLDDVEASISRKVQLQTDITAAQTLHDNATEGSDPGEYAVGSKATLQSAITAATTVHNNPAATLAQVNTAITTLETAVATFEAGLV